MTTLRCLLVAAMLAAPAARAAGQAPVERCDLVIPPSPGRPATLIKQPSGNYNSFLGGGVFARCEGQPVTLRADSAEYYEDSGILYLIGNVHYVEPRATLDSRRATYYRTDERLLAEGDVVATLPSGTVLRGPRVDYYRAVAGLRPQSRLIATGRPRTTLVQVDSAGRPEEPVDIVANTIVTEADSLVYASGSVEITRPDVVARGDSAFFDTGREYARLMLRPSIRGTGERPFELRGRTIDLFSEDRQLRRVLAADSALAESEDVDLAADTIDLRIGADRSMERAFAFGTGLSRATSETSDIVADSIEIVLPGQRLREVRAIGDAFAQSIPDTLEVATTERDWLRGDEIVAYFDTLAAPGESAQARIRELVASGGARSYYHIPPEEGVAAPPSINYVRGRIITVAFVDQEVDVVTVTDQAAGVYLEPVRAAPTPAASDTASPPQVQP